MWLKMYLNVYKFTKDSLWKPIRKATSPTLSQSSVIGMVPIFIKHLDNLLITMENHLNKGTFNVEECLVKFGIEQVFGKFFLV